MKLTFKTRRQLGLSLCGTIQKLQQADMDQVQEIRQHLMEVMQNGKM